MSSDFAAGWSSLVARRAHNPKVVGSNPTPATIEDRTFRSAVFLFLRLKPADVVWHQRRHRHWPCSIELKDLVMIY